MGEVEADIIETLYQQGMSYHSIAIAVGVSAPALWKIRHGETQPHASITYRLQVLADLRTMRAPRPQRWNDE